MRAQEGQAQENPESTGGGPTGPGWVIQIVAHHFHNEDRHRPEEGEQFVRGTIVKNLNGEGAPITITVGPKAGSQVSVEELGIGFPVIVRSEPLRKVFVTQTAPGGAPGGAGVAGAIPDLAGSGVPGGRRPGDEQLELKRHDFVLQFVWQPVEAPHQPIAPAQFAAPGGSGF